MVDNQHDTFLRVALTYYRSHGILSWLTVFRFPQVSIPAVYTNPEDKEKKTPEHSILFTANHPSPLDAKVLLD